MAMGQCSHTMDFELPAYDPAPKDEAAHQTIDKDMDMISLGGNARHATFAVRTVRMCTANENKPTFQLL